MLVTVWYVPYPGQRVTMVNPATNDIEQGLLAFIFTNQPGE